ncbi:Flagellar biosynthetic protein FliR [Sodalis glossinidius str. 'morsitans']|uniref:Flagellar biosynthetic protein FliR n=1 Tax=Sodalis glossinidius (strain morsitans) TaxID=343509 RepID=Q2NR92_SODGM|nr:flagellar biosynthetic protein FliR [Sodalis glossinidius]BAE75333.1 flagellar biosynthetic protein FliR [Sodalis glossinidius str. 'morsitans']CRL46350.1 Flagellar biosynthetic protein FliR [Sodalis glossinidius str. 'morsitans']
MLHWDSGQLAALLPQLFWPLLRILALISTAPLFSEKSILAPIKLGLGILIALLIAPSLPAVDSPLFSLAGFWLALKQILIGTALGLTMQLTFAAVRMAGEVIGLQMGLSFTTFFDPASGLNTPLLARLLNLLALLVFISLNGHLWLLSLLADSFHILPLDSQLMDPGAFMALARAGGIIFLNGMMLALPLICMLMTLNIALGLLNRITPQLTVFVIGFPLTLTVGILTFSLLLPLPLLAPSWEKMMGEVFDLLSEILRGMTR